MDYQKELRELVDLVVARTNKTQEQLAVELGYGRTYISESLAPTGKVSHKFLNAFKKHYADVLENPKNSYATAGVVPVTDLIREIRSKAEEIKRHNHILENIIEANLTALLTSQNVILSQIKAGQKYEARKDANGDHRKEESILHEIGKYSGEYFLAMTKAGIHADDGK